MKAIHITKSGGPEVLQIKESPRPKPQKSEVLIKVKAAGVNRSDVITRKNTSTYGKEINGTIIPGLEVSGEIIEIGEDVSDKKIGDKVCALITRGGYAEYVAVESSHCLTIPEGISLTDAAALPETVFTVWFNVFQLGKLQPGEKLLIHGGTSGIGTMGLQMAKAMGSKIYTTAGTDKKVDFLNNMDLGSVINYKKEAFEDVLKDEKIDVILDMVGGDYTQKNLEILNTKGRLININGMKSNEVNINLRTIMAKNLILTGSFLKPQSAQVKTQIAKEVEKNIWPLFHSEKIRPIIYKKFPLEDASEAHKLMESSEHIGKILLTMD
ncbi:putative NAD(P)H quinone oxidoreductase, PIG3 family [Aequorivita sublithincola DSM 14238]|uniref:Putative NAD(P)H quinone oxidoreductase, PIG3 family n=1 Tax=Aequorivita sublithincola (strain DSM 14238 / LMG 21431 / ACAM 643 / 9-3) TaxID=746697 RepID=I3YXV3_AEQSU|nr:NAD(P)H-quinone oxidoreductase [Aequorivita sublithincola]AFL81821.1 putative NAD(P)H quinone oxidoreductase, PIG3 family [Aequorivita sublithincola DSM 14238]